MKILLFGKNGQVGWELQRSLACLGEVVALDRRSEALCGDLADLEGITRTVDAVRPDAIVNAAAYTAVDRAESEPDQADRINAEAPRALAAAARRHRAWLVHYSTDYVFSGTGDQPWREGDRIEPASVYGRTKAEGEHAVAEGVQNHLVFRTSWVYALRGGNFLHTMLRLAREKESLTVVDDQFGAPTGAELIADVTAHALRMAVQGSAPSGVYHLAAAGVTTWHAYASHVIEQARRSPRGAEVRVGPVDPVPSSAYRTAARRPHNSRLSTEKLQQAFGLRLPPWQQGVDRVLAEMGWGAGA